MWLFARMDNLVPAKSARLPETLSADLADKRTSPSVNGHVSCEVVVGVEHFAALLTGERLLLAVGRVATGR